ncbi:Fpg/Nei family DNA glycosylase [Spongisporangium articulatum]|uniref:Fpg/Nei family DNA glycosylase n=1 Tax=Spongisporangium articulatum TaxID=3362603 RepID=A0ABW8AMN3_9ACTN
MPELPEVETARAAIERSGLGRRIVDVDDTDSYECRPHAPGQIRAALVGHEFTVAHRRGKSMWVETDGGPVLGLHLGMSGKIVAVEATPDGAAVADQGGDYWNNNRPVNLEALRKWSRFSLTFSDGGRLHLLDPRRLGRARLDPDVSGLGPDAFDVGRNEFRARVGRGRIPLKARLLDQETIAGVGNLLADEALWRARLDPRRPAGDLTTEELDGLRRAVRAAVRHAITHGGVHTGEIVPFRKAGEHCPRCGTEMRRATVGGRTTWWCPEEQR